MRSFHGVIGTGRAVIPQGQRKQIKLIVPKAVRKQLIRMRRRGARSLKGRVITRAGIVPGVTSKKTKKVTVKLVKSKKKKSKRRKR